MIDDTGNVQQCVNDRANIMCELSLAAADKQLCLDKTIGLPTDSHLNLHEHYNAAWCDYLSALKHMPYAIVGRSGS